MLLRVVAGVTPGEAFGRPPGCAVQKVGPKSAAAAVNLA